MKGTTKQVAWAEKIKANAIKAIEGTIAQIESMNVPADKKAAAIAERHHRLEKVNSLTYAGDMIDCFKDVNPDDLFEAIRTINAAFRYQPALH